MEVLYHPHPVLRYVTRPVVRVDKQLREFATSMVGLMVEENGAGLAANQVGLPFRMFVMRTETQHPVCFINPEVKPLGVAVAKNESCLSLPGLSVNVYRRPRCHFKAWVLNGDTVNGIITGLPARIIQHEMDHLDGIMISDRMSAHQKQYGNVVPELKLMESAWEKYPKEFPVDEFNELLYRYTDVKWPEKVETC